MGTSSNFGNMLSMAVAAAFLPFLPLLPVQILLNNFLYDLSQLTIPTDNVDESYVAQPRKWDMRLIQRFMFGLGPVSSLYDFLTFGLLCGVPCRPRDVPGRLVRRVACDPDAGDLRYSNHAPPLERVARAGAW